MNTERLDTLDALLARFVAGTLPRPAEVLIGSHLEIKDTNRKFVAGLEDMAGEALEQVDPAQLTDRNAMLERILSSGPDLGSDDPLLTPATTSPKPAVSDVFPSALQNFIGHTSSSIPWRTKMPGFKEYHVGEVDGCDVSMFWIRAGRAIPDHTHEGSELTLVLDGGFSDGFGHYDRGDISIADETVDHRPVADDDGPCIGFAITTAPLRLTGSLSRIFADVFGR